MLTIKQINSILKPINFIGDENTVISKPIELDSNNTDPNVIMWVNDKNIDKLNLIKSGTIICSNSIQNFQTLCNYIIVPNPRSAFRNLLFHFFVNKKENRIEETARIHESVILGKEITIGHNVVIEEGCEIGDYSTIGHNSVIHSNTKVENHVIIGANCTIGGVGFGYEKNAFNEYEFIPHVGNVIIKERSEVGNNTCIDRAVLGSTVIGKNVKIDNLVHIAHGVKIGSNSLIIAHAMIGGSTEIGENVWFAPSASILNKRKIENNATIGMGAVVVKDVFENEIVVGNPGKPLNK